MSYDFEHTLCAIPPKAVDQKHGRCCTVKPPRPGCHHLPLSLKLNESLSVSSDAYFSIVLFVALLLIDIFFIDVAFLAYFPGGMTDSRAVFC
jgi:hypothetical protein